MLPRFLKKNNKRKNKIKIGNFMNNKKTIISPKFYKNFPTNFNKNKILLKSF